MSKPVPIIKPRRKVPISRTKVSHFDPNWEVNDNHWDEYRWRHAGDWRPSTRITRERTPQTTTRQVTHINRGSGVPIVKETGGTTTMSLLSKETGSVTDRFREMEKEMDREMNRMWQGRNQDSLFERKSIFPGENTTP